MPIPQGFQKAKLEIDGQQPIECMFNPQEYTIVKTNVWSFKPRTGVDRCPRACRNRLVAASDSTMAW